MTTEAAVRLLPNQTEIEVQNACVIMTDVLRASSTIVTALSNGARCVVPRAEIEDSRELAAKLKKSGNVILGGERNGEIISGFDHGNSPLEYSQDTVQSKALVLCTTNGTWALEYCREAREILIGALINLDAIVDVAANHARVVVVCAGTNREITGEDVLFAGGVMAGLVSRFPNLQLESNALRALAVWRDVARYQTGDLEIPGSGLASDNSHGQPETEAGSPFYRYLLNTRGGQNLARLEYFEDIRYCATLNSHSATPRLDQQAWTIQ